MLRSRAYAQQARSFFIVCALPLYSEILSERESEKNDSAMNTGVSEGMVFETAKKRVSKGQLRRF